MRADLVNFFHLREPGPFLYAALGFAHTTPANSRRIANRLYRAVSAAVRVQPGHGSPRSITSRPTHARLNACKANIDNRFGFFTLNARTARSQLAPYR